MPMTRRHAILAATALPLAAPALVGARAARAQDDPGAAAAAPFPLHRAFALGDRRLVMLLAGAMPQENPHDTFGLNVDAAAFEQASEENFIPADRNWGFMQPVLLDTGDARILFDTGFNAGGLLAAMADAGLQPADVTHVVLTHMHPDHIGGLIGDDGQPTFPDASHVAGRAEFDFWAGQANEAFEAKVRPLADRFQFIEPEAEVAPGVTALDTSGHTPGHLSYRVEAERGPVLLNGDVVNHYVWSMQHPDWEVRFDMDKAAAAETRRRVLGMLAQERGAMHGYHMPAPGVGFVEARGDGFFWVPTSYQFA